MNNIAIIVNVETRNEKSTTRQAFVVSYRGVEQLIESGLDVQVLFGPDQQVYASDVRARVQQFFHQHFAHEPRGAGDEYVTAAEEVRYGAACHFDAIGNCNEK